MSIPVPGRDVGCQAAHGLCSDVEIGACAGSDIGERIDALLRGIDQLRYRRRIVGIHPREACRDGKLRHAGLGADHCGDEARRVHGAVIMAAKFKKG